MTEQELDERIEKMADDWELVNWQADKLKQLIRDCIEAVTPEKKNSKDYVDIGHNKAIETIEFNTKELLG